MVRDQNHGWALFTLWEHDSFALPSAPSQSLGPVPFYELVHQIHVELQDATAPHIESIVLEAFDRVVQCVENEPTLERMDDQVVVMGPALLLSRLLTSVRGLSLLRRVCVLLVTRSRAAQARVVDNLARLSGPLLGAIVDNLNAAVSERLQLLKVTDDTVGVAVMAMKLAYRANQRSRVLPHSRFHNNTVSECVDPVDDYAQWVRAAQPSAAATRSFSFCQYPFVLDAAAKSRILRLAARAPASSGLFLRSVFGGQATTLQLAVRRDFLLTDAAEQLGRPDAELRLPLQVRFVGEEGFDTGGLTKEFFMLAVRRFTEPEFGLVTWDVARGLCVLRSPSPLSLSMFRLFGTLLALAVHNNTILDLRFPLLFYRRLLNLPPSLHDLSDCAPELHRSLRALLEYDGDDVEQVFGLTHAVDVALGGVTYHYQIVPGGERVPVTQRNKHAFVQRLVQFLAHDVASAEAATVRQGFVRVFDASLLSILQPEELEMLLCGNPDLDMHELEAVATYEGGFSATHPVVRWFWRLVHSLPAGDRRRLLQFVTGTDRAPIKGLASIRFHIQRAGPDSDNLPTAHTCFNTLLLPEYASEQKLVDKVRRVLDHATEGFGLV